MTGERDPVFIVGTPRSGTTLTARLLGNLPDLFIPGETHFFDDICRDRKTIDRPLRAETRKQVLERLRTSYGRFGETEDQNRVDRLASDGSLDAALSACPTYRDLFATFMQLQAAQSGKPRWGNHVPKDAFELDTILHLFPGARLIGCIRDPRDFLVSYRDYWRTMTEPFARRIRGLYHPVVTSLLWKVTARALLKAADDRRDVFMLSRYEDLVANTAAHVEKLCSHIVEPFDPAATRTNYNNSSVHTRTDGVHAMSIGRWHDSLSAEDIVIAQYLCAREMKRLGYAREAVSAPPARVLKRLASTPAGLLRALRLRSSIGLADSYMITRLRFLFGGART